MKIPDLDMISELLERRGQLFIPEKLPADIPRGELGKCFDWCALQAVVSRGKYRYVEGVARPLVGDPKPKLHAWLTDGWEIFAYDPTWSALTADGDQIAIPADFLGIVMPIRAVAAFMKETGYQGVLANAWRNPEIAAYCIGEEIRK